jgi:alkylated DNA repair protein alkB family protein 1
VETLFEGAFRAESGVVLLYGAKDYMPVHRDVSEECQRGLASFTVGCDGLFIISKEKKPLDGKDGGDWKDEKADGEEGKREEGKDSEDDGREMEMCVLRVRSGDCVWMGGETRWCWHAMPKIMAGTCPEWLADWPVGQNGEGEKKEFERWKGFMSGKRLNISCRQVWS